MQKGKQSKKDTPNKDLLNLITFAPLALALLLSLVLKNRVDLCAFIAGFTGVIIVVRKEIPMAFRNITGTRAVVEGAILIIFFWSAAIYIAIYGL